ncbi:hypothetical protein FUAX_50610 (plasmid) [Fulvitalea axinellae]|uniref:Uncharacterized protein n=1 Tax=Fulvitalea axinellae TaxID=1182444 RepID=A0AAU9CKR6_9BACT|nr:hypothetical protein FUAX_50610 [Fulvitalea axinellae]
MSPPRSPFAVAQALYTPEEFGGRVGALEDAEPEERFGDEFFGEVDRTLSEYARVSELVEQLGKLPAEVSGKKRGEPCPIRMREWAFTKEQLSVLDRLEHRCYDWLNGKINYMGRQRPFVASVLDLLNDIQAEHERLTYRMMTREYRLWTPDLEEGCDEYGLANDAWTRLLTDSGRLVVSVRNSEYTESPHQRFPGFRAVAMSRLLRLMSRPFGRNLVNQLAFGDKKVAVYPNDKQKEGVGVGIWRGSRKGPYEGRFKEPPTREKPFPEMRATEGCDAFVTLSLPHSQDAGRLCFDDSWTEEQFGKLDIDFATAMREGEMPEAEEEELAVSIRERQDSDELTELAKGLGTVTLLPGFLSLGHELGHAKHMTHGDYRSAPADLYNPDNGAERFWGNNEEHFAITQYENKIREEHGLRPRKWHIITNYMNANVAFPRLPKKDRTMFLARTGAPN